MAPPGWTEPLTISDVAHAWIFPNAAVLYTESLLEVPRLDHVKSLFDFFTWVNEHVPIDEPATLVHDWRSFRSVPLEVRRAFAAQRHAMKAANQSPGVRRVVVATSASPVVRLGIQAVSLAAQMIGVGVPVELVSEPEKPLLERVRTPPDPGLHARLRLAWRHAEG
ncbi:MAG: hypothetical protein U0271_47115 [Polyangiaceae bacterium]